MWGGVSSAPVRNVLTSDPGEGPLRRLSLALVDHSMAAPRRVLAVVAGLTVVFLGSFVFVEIDTDPENMLAEDAPVRVENAELRSLFGSNQLLVVGLFGEGAVTDAATLDAAVGFHDALAAVDGVESATMLSVATARPGAGLASVPDEAAAAALVAAVEADPLLTGNVLSADRDTLAIFVPLASKADAQPVRDAADALLDASPELGSFERHVAGLPLAQEAFGEQMFLQMAVFAPMAGLVIFVLMLVFFRRLALVGPAMALALVSVIWAMGALIATGNTLHIMSSMIPIFLMPIAILDAVHVISEFFDELRTGADRETAIRRVYRHLAGPIAFTSITTIVGFTSLLLTPIPPVQVFGAFIAFGVVIAWLSTLTLLPALLMVIRAETLARVGLDSGAGGFGRAVASLPRFGVRARRLVIGGAVVVAAAAGVAALGTEVNDNPVNWFRSSHEVRVATERLNDELPGTFGANLVLRADDGAALTAPATIEAVAELQRRLADDPSVGATASYVDLLGGATDDDAVDRLAVLRNPLVDTLVTPELDVANLRLQLRSGDNQTMSAIVEATAAQLRAAPLPDGVTATWAGETYLNLVWQEEMVSGMLVGFAVTLAIITVLLSVLFRSLRWALLAMIPVVWTIVVVYGVIAAIGKDVDMPIAVLSTLVLGIGVDFAIHFVERFRELRAELGDARAAIGVFAGEPARALTRNAAVISIGFLPLLFSSLTPYVIVGLFLAGIIVLGWLATVVLLPATVSSR